MITKEIGGTTTLSGGYCEIRRGSHDYALISLEGQMPRFRNNAGLNDPYRTIG